MSPPRVSVIVPTRNRAALLRNAVDSVLAQTEGDLELILVDDASTDCTRAVIEALCARDPRVRGVYNSAPAGGAGARNAGLAVSRGEWVAFLDDDDEWLPGKLARQLQRLNSDPAAVACSCSYILRFASGSRRVVRIPDRVTMPQLLVYNSLGGASLCLCSGTVVREIGGFDPAFPAAQDHDLWVRLLQRGPVISCNEPLVLYASHDGARITNNSRAQHIGARRFYFKYRRLMDGGVRRQRIAYGCYIMSRELSRSLRHRLRYLMLATRYAPIGASARYLASALPRLAGQTLRAALQSWLPSHGGS